MEELPSKSTEVENVVEKRRVDISKLVSIIPSASELRGEERKGLTEKRIRVKYDETIQQGYAKLSKELASMLGIGESDFVEIVVAGRRKFVYKAIVVEGLDPNVVFCHPAELREKGVSDNSIATVRKHVAGVS